MRSVSTRHPHSANPLPLHPPTVRPQPLVLALQSHPAVVWAVLAIDLASLHLVKVAQGEWNFVYADPTLPGNLLLWTVLWLLPRFCPVWTARMPHYFGPANFARVIACGFAESAAFAVLALRATDSPTREQELAVLRYACVPAGCVALLALAGFLLLIEPRHRASFWRHDPREAYWRRRGGRGTATHPGTSTAAVPSCY